MSSGKDIRIGIVGTGAMAAEMSRAAGTLPDVTVSAILSRSAERATAFGHTFADGVTGCSTQTQFFDLIDAVYVATPPNHHAEIVEAAIAAGKAVLCEKPLTGGHAQTARLLEKARGANVLLMEAVWTLALPAYQAARSAIRNRQGALLQFDFSYPIQAARDSHYFDPKKGGVLLDRGVYGYAAAISLLGDVLSQTVTVTRDSAGLDTSAQIQLQHGEAARSIITLSLDRVGPNTLHVTTADGLISLGPTSLAAETLRVTPCPDMTHASPGAPAKPGLKDRLKAMPALRKLKGRMPAGGQFHGYGASSYAPVLQEFVETLRRGGVESAVVPHGLSEQVARLTEAARATS